MPRHWLAAALSMLVAGGGSTATGEDGRPGAAATGMSKPLTPPDARAPGAGSDFTALEAAQNADNKVPGPRKVPGRSIPVPDTVSPAFATLVGAPYRVPDWDANPQTPERWRRLVLMLATATSARLPALQEKLGVTSEPVVVGGVRAFLVQAKTIPAAHRDKVILQLHGGGYVYNPGEAGTIEAVLMAGFGGYKVIAVDYRMPPDHPYPAAMDDAMAAYRAIIAGTPPGKVAIVGTSAGGAMTLALCLRAKSEHLPLPAAIAPGTPWSDLTATGDTRRTNEWLDNVIVSYHGYLSRAVDLYAGGHDLRDPQLSPIYGDFAGMPPAILTSGTRDLLLSDTVRTHRKLRKAGVEAQLQVFEGMAHAQYLMDADAPETRDVFTEITRFLDAHFSR